MGGQYSIQNTKELFDLGVAAVMAIKAAKADGKIDLADLGQLMIIFPKAGPAFDQIDLVPKELGELDELESKELLEHASKSLGMAVEDPVLVEKIVAVLKVGTSLGEAVSKL